jgi:hypothetical protein
MSLTGLARSVEKIDARAAAVSGLAAGAAFALTLEADLRLTGRNADDLLILGWPIVQDRVNARRVGLALHLVNSVALAELYAAVHHMIPGPMLLRGVVFASLENVALYPVTLLEDRHPAIRTGQVDRYFTWPAFWQSVPRHIVYGAVLGTLYGKLRFVVT